MYLGTFFFRFFRVGRTCTLHAAFVQPCSSFPRHIPAPSTNIHNFLKHILRRHSHPSRDHGHGLSFLSRIHNHLGKNANTLLLTVCTSHACRKCATRARRTAGASVQHVGLRSFLSWVATLRLGVILDVRFQPDDHGTSLAFLCFWLNLVQEG